MDEVKEAILVERPDELPLDRASGLDDSRQKTDREREGHFSRPGQPLNLGRKVRTATPTQRRALIARDQTCVIPNCTLPAAFSAAHHLQYWSKGGTTDASNLAMVCGRHHTDVHAGTWELEMRDGIPWAKPPTWLDPHQ